MANLKAKFVTYTTVAVILVLDVRICGQLKTALFKATKISNNFHRKFEEKKTVYKIRKLNYFCYC